MIIGGSSLWTTQQTMGQLIRVLSRDIYGKTVPPLRKFVSFGVDSWFSNDWYIRRSNGEGWNFPKKKVWRFIGSQIVDIVRNDELR